MSLFTADPADFRGPTLAVWREPYTGPLALVRPLRDPALDGHDPAQPQDEYDVEASAIAWGCAVAWTLALVLAVTVIVLAVT